MVDVSKIKVGDEIVVRTKVRELGDKGFWCGSPTRYFQVPPAEIEEHHPAPPKPPVVGNRVRIASFGPIAGDVGTIKLIEGGEACIWWPDSGLGVHQLDQLERVSDE